MNIKNEDTNYLLRITVLCIGLYYSCLSIFFYFYPLVYSIIHYNEKINLSILIFLPLAIITFLLSKACNNIYNKLKLKLK